jgi:hypothetical protein
MSGRKPFAALSDNSPQVSKTLFDGTMTPSTVAKKPPVLDIGKGALIEALDMTMIENILKSPVKRPGTRVRPPSHPTHLCTQVTGSGIQIHVIFINTFSSLRKSHAMKTYPPATVLTVCVSV